MKGLTLPHNDNVTLTKLNTDLMFTVMDYITEASFKTSTF